MPIYDLLNLTFSAILMYVAVLAAFEYIRSSRQRKRAVALDFIKRWNDGEYTKVFSRILSEPENQDKDIRDILLSKTTVVSFDRKELTKQYEVERIWNFFEELSIAILFNQADEDIAKEFFLYSLHSTYKVSERAIIESRKKNVNNSLYLNFERLVGKWTSDKNFILVKEVSR